MGKARVVSVLPGPTMHAAEHVGLTSLLQRGLLLLFLAVPFHSILVFPGVSVVKLAGIALASIWLVWLVEQLGLPRGPWIMPRQNVGLILSFGVLIASILLSAFYAPISSLFRTSLMTIVFGAAMAVVICTSISSEALLRRAYAYLTIGATIAGSLVIAQYAAPERVTRILGQRVYVEEVGVRATGPFRDPNYGALTLLVLVVLSFHLALTWRKRWQRTLLLIGVAVQVVAVLLTFSRAAYIVLGITGLVVLWRERHRLYLWKAALAAVISFILLAMFGGGILKLVAFRVGSLVNFVHVLWHEPKQARQLDLSLWYRFQLLRAGVKMAFDKFPIGIGWENFCHQITRYSEEAPELGAHNTYVVVAAELGLPGLIALAWLLWALWESTGRLCKIAPDRLRLLARGTRYGLLTVLIGGLFLTVFHEAVVWTLIGLIMTQNQVALGTAKNKRDRDHW